MDAQLKLWTREQFELDMILCSIIQIQITVHKPATESKETNLNLSLLQIRNRDCQKVVEEDVLLMTLPSL